MILPALLLHSSKPGAFIFWCVLGFGAGIWLFVQGFRLLQRRQLILNTPVSRIRSAALGMVELNGLAAGPYTMVAPITERSCFYYRTQAWEWKQAGKSKQWVKVAAECMHVPFFLDDNTGKVLIDPRGADLDLHCDFKEEFCDSFFTTKQEAPANVHSFLSRHGVTTSNKIKVEEFCIKPKNALFLLGTLDENPGLELSPHPIQDIEATTLNMGGGLSLTLKSSMVTFASEGNGSSSIPVGNVPLGEEVVGGHTLRELGFDKSDLYRRGFDKSAHGPSSQSPSSQVIHLSTDPAPDKAADMTQQQKIAAALLKAGIVNPIAWAAAGVSTGGLGGNKPSGPSESDGANGNGSNGNGSDGNGRTDSQPSPDGFDPHPPVVLMKGKNNPTFLISWRSQRDLARSLGWKCALMIWGGPAIALVSLYGLLELGHWF